MATQTQTKLKKVRFLSGAKPSFKMIRRSQGEIVMPNNNVANDPSKPEISYQFHRGALELREGQDMLPDKIDPETGDVVEQDAIEWIRSQPDFDSIVYEVVPEAPPSSEILKQVAAAAAAGDVQALVALGDEEAGSWAREDVLDVIRDAVERLTAEPQSAA